MKAALLLAGLAVSMTLAAVPAAAPAQEAATVAPPPPAPAADQVEASRAAIINADLERLIEDRTYAREILRHLDVLESATDEPRMRMAIDSLRLTALEAIGDRDQIPTVIDRILAARPRDSGPYISAWWAALSLADTRRAAAAIEQASRSVAGIHWGELRTSLGDLEPSLVLAQLGRDDQDATRVQLAEALFRIGWPGGGDLERANDLRVIILKFRLEQGDVRDAADMAAGLTEPAAVLPLLVLRRYDPLVAGDVDRLARLQGVLADYDRQTLEALGSEPRAGPALQRAHFLRGVGRESETVTLLEPFTRDVAATVRADFRGMWVINEAAYALQSLGRHDEAVALMQRLVALPVAEHTDLIGPYINHSIVLLEAGRPAEALAWATRLEREFSQHANNYGKMWIASSIVCSLAMLDRSAEAGPTLERLRAGVDDNAAALTRAHLCMNDLDAAEAVIIRRLADEDPEAAVLALQDYQIMPSARAGLDALSERLRLVRERPAVRQALERVGRVLQLPLAQTYWGGV